MNENNVLIEELIVSVKRENSLNDINIYWLLGDSLTQRNTYVHDVVKTLCAKCSYLTEYTTYTDNDGNTFNIQKL